MIALAKAGAGLACTADLIGARELSACTLQTVLQLYLRTAEGLHLYFPSRSQTQLKLRAFIDFLTQRRSRVSEGEE
jgi:DNA-binding transcriptional LysR family regulator